MICLVCYLLLSTVHRGNTRLTHSARRCIERFTAAAAAAADELISCVIYDVIYRIVDACSCMLTKPNDATSLR